MACRGALLALLASGLFGLLGGPVSLSDLPQRLLLWLPTFLTVTLFIGGNEEQALARFCASGAADKIASRPYNPCSGRTGISR